MGFERGYGLLLVMFSGIFLFMMWDNDDDGVDRRWEGDLEGFMWFLGEDVYL